MKGTLRRHSKDALVANVFLFVRQQVQPVCNFRLQITVQVRMEPFERNPLNITSFAYASLAEGERETLPAGPQLMPCFLRTT